jgi:hypothetical protein
MLNAFLVNYFITLLLFRRYYFILIMLIFSIQSNINAQSKIFKKDSLASTSVGKLEKNVKKIPKEILKGIIAGDYEKIGWNEYIPRDGFTLSDLPLITEDNHPRMITKAQILKAKNNIHRSPYIIWYNLLIREAGKENIYPNSPMYKIADKLKILAFLYCIEDDPNYLMRIHKLLRFVPESHTYLTFQGGKRGVGWGDFLESAQALTVLCLAMDLVYYDIDKSLRKETIRKMLKITQQLLESMKHTPANNHVIVSAIAILEMAMLEDRPDEFITYNQQQLWNKGLWHLSRGLGRITPDGGYAESVYYARFILSYLAAMSVHFENMTGIRLFDHIYLDRLVNWVISNDKGSGYFSAFDDHLEPEYFIFPIIIPKSVQASYWHTYWKSNSDYTKALPNMVEGLCVYKEFVTSTYYLPEEVQFFPDFGQAIFRDKTIKPNIYGSFLAERERWFADRHEHIDPLTFEISAYGEDIIVEGGYGFGISEYYRSTWYTSPYAHNGILIDGVGTYRNPIWGDSIGSSIHHAFSTSRNSSATLQHKIQDVEINRKIYFLNSRYFLVIDRLKGNRSHSMAININHKGNFRQISENKFNINVNNSGIDIAHLNSVENKSLITFNYGQLTPPLPASPIKSFQIEQPDMKEGYFATLFFPKENIRKNFSTAKIPVIGNGEVQRISMPGQEFGDQQWAINRGGVLKTSRWQSDASVLFLQSNPTGALQSLLLIDFTYFREQNIKIESDLPITLFLERNEEQWLGYIESDSESNVRITGISIKPVRFNHQLLQTFVVKDSSELHYELNIPGSGSLEFGPGRGRVNVAYRFFNHPNFLVWLKDRPRRLKNYNSWTDYEKQVFQNQIVSNMFRGFNQVTRIWSESIFRNPEIFSLSINSIGMFQETLSDPTYSTYDIAHRYHFNGKFGNSKWEFLEDGTLTEKGVLLRNLFFRASNKQGRSINYRYYSWFEDHASHYIRLHSDHRNFILYQNSQSTKNQQQQVQLNFDRSGYFVNPGYIWNKEEQLRHIFLNGGIDNFHGSFRHSTTPESDISFESIYGYSDNYAFSFEGEQKGHKKQSYQGNLLYYFSDRVRINQGLQLQKTEKWTLPAAITEVNWNFSTHALHAGLIKKNSDYFQQFSFYSNFKDGYISTHLNLDKFHFANKSMLKVEGNFDFDHNYKYYANALYYFNRGQDKYNTDIYQNLWLPISLSTFLHPSVQICIPQEDPFKSFGIGLTNYNYYPVFTQILLFRNRKPVILDYQFSIQNLNFLINSNLQFWVHFQQNGELLESSEFKIQNASYNWQPGLYYWYKRNLGSRWEGYLEWYW